MFPGDHKTPGLLSWVKKNVSPLNPKVYPQTSAFRCPENGEVLFSGPRNTKSYVFQATPFGEILFCQAPSEKRIPLIPSNFWARGQRPTPGSKLRSQISKKNFRAPGNQKRAGFRAPETERDLVSMARKVANPTFCRLTSPVPSWHRFRAPESRHPQFPGARKHQKRCPKT